MTTLNPNEIQQAMQEWAELQTKIKIMEDRCKLLKGQVEDAVLAGGVPVESDMAKVLITSRGTFDWHDISLQLEPDDAVIKKHTSTDWKKVAEETGPDDKLKFWKEKCYTPGAEYASLRLKGSK
jgi:hypothetical protein